MDGCGRAIISCGIDGCVLLSYDGAVIYTVSRSTYVNVDGRRVLMDKEKVV